MPEDRSLDEFAVGSGGGEEQDDAGDAVDDSEEMVDDVNEVADGAEPIDGDDVNEAAAAEATDADPAVPTATWTTDGAACDRCGERAPRRWLDDGDLVCGTCKEW